MKFNDAVSGVFFILFGLLLFYLTRGFPTMPGQNYGPDLFPRLIGVAMMVSGVLLILKGLRLRHQQAWFSALEWMHTPRLIGNFAMIIGVVVWYIFISDDLGFLLTAFTCLFVMLTWLRGMPFWKSSGLISLAAVLVMNLFFGQFLRVPLPWGIFQAYAF